MQRLHIGDYVQLHLVRAAPGSVGDGGVVQVVRIECDGERILYTGAYGHGGAVQFRGAECTIIRRTKN